ncbi:hypothetical protein CALVIDRAFT_341206 [Calocera viscosa TUFC12733]|uniref:Chromosome transmission fidelity protein 8 n=1 Tax=Calocera viscosa (strain TUFC12733) TaxID=1330018 RepID=A0A167HEB4_CALVF|nr:hypothetical protein CALVIDRAFT_341206 [Calocera viscosa TUFC12733]
MLIPITRPSTSSDPPLPPNLIKLGSTLLLLELQGSLVVSGVPEDGEGGGVVGEFTMNEEKPTLRIGHHMLEGKVVTLPKPLAVLRKRVVPASSQPRIPTPSEESPLQKEEDDMMLDEAAGGTSYEVVEVVRKKVVFSRRPALVVDKPAVAGGKRP